MKHHKFAVIGLGSFGSNLALALAKSGNEVLAVDNDRARVEDIKDAVTSALIMDATDERAIRELALEDYDAVILALGDHLHASVILVSLLHDLGLRRIIVQINNHKERRILTRLGAHETLYPEEDSGDQLARRLTLQGVQAIYPMGGGFSLATLKAPDAYIGKTILEIRPRERDGINIVALYREQHGPAGRSLHCLGAPPPDHTFRFDDFLCVFCKEDRLAHLLD